jgi:Family of unknown function (DUF5678)
MADSTRDRDRDGRRGAYPDSRASVDKNRAKESPALDLSPYAGRWVAVVNGRVVAVGQTARDALLAAYYQRLKDEPALIWIPTAEQ